MFSTLLCVLLCLSPLVVSGTFHNVADGFIQAAVHSRLDQCVLNFPKVLYEGECTMTKGKSFAKYLEEDSCKALWCITQDTDRQFVCVEAGMPEYDTPCAEGKVCRNGSCVPGGFHYRG